MSVPPPSFLQARGQQLSNVLLAPSLLWRKGKNEDADKKELATDADPAWLAVDRIRSATTLAQAAVALSDVVIVNPTVAAPDANSREIRRLAGSHNSLSGVTQVKLVLSDAALAASLVDHLVHRRLASAIVDGPRALLRMLAPLQSMCDKGLPGVLHVAVEPTSTADIADVLALRDTGVIILSSRSPEESTAMAVSAHLMAVRSQTPVVHFYPRVSTLTASTSAVVAMASLQHHLKQLSDKHQDSESSSAAASATPTSLYLSLIDTDDDATTAAAAHAPAVTADAIWHDLYSSYSPFDSSSASAAASSPVIVLVATGAVAVELESAAALYNASKESTAPEFHLVHVRLVRPWDSQRFLASLPSSTSIEAIVVLDTVAWGPLFTSVASSDGVDASTRILAAIVGQDGRRASVAPADLARLVASANDPDATQLNICQPVTVDAVVASSVTTGTPANPSYAPYLRLLEQVIARESLTLIDLEASAATSLSGENALGQFAAHDTLRLQLEQRVTSVISSGKVSKELRAALSQWLATNTSDACNEVAETITRLVKSESVSELSDHVHLLQRRSKWILAGDRLGDDLALSGVHSLVASGERVRLLVVTTDDLLSDSDDGLWAHRQLRKNIGLYAMNYGSVYVASIAVHWSYTQALEAVQQAEAFDGPAVILAYAPIVRTDQGVALASRASHLATLQATKRAVDAGVWPLYRWNPLRNGEPFQLDSAKTRADIEQFLQRDQHLAHVAHVEPQLDGALAQTGGSELVRGYAHHASLLQDSFARLVSGLKADPTLILYSSDGGNAEKIAARIASEGTKRGVPTQLLVMDDYCSEDPALSNLPGEGQLVVVVSTAGQGEFPSNGRAFWKALSSTALDLTSLKSAVFAMGDSHYWPRPEDAAYYCKAGVDMDRRLTLLGSTPLCDIGYGDDQDADGFETGYAAWVPSLWAALGVATAADADGSNSAVVKIADDDIKRGSNYLRGTIVEGLQDTTTGALPERDTKLTKFHGIYQQDDRDLREQRRRDGLEKAFSFMVRVRVPGGISTAAQYLAMDALAESHGSGTVKLTTRQAFQLHGIIKKNLRSSIQEINRALMDTLAACGDVNRNVMCTPAPNDTRAHAEVDRIVRALSTHLSPQTSAYHEIWLLDEVGKKKQVAGNAVQLDGAASAAKGGDEVEPLYGATYLPRKFKIAFAIPPHNDTDVFAHCLGFIAIIDEASGELQGFNVTIGGGMGMTHNNKKTYPCVAKPLGFCLPEQVLDVGESVMLVQRDHGDRQNRKHARLKYTLEDHGVAWFRLQVEQRLGYALEASREYTFKSNGDRFGWHEGHDGTWTYGMYIENGRIGDTPGMPIKTALRELATELMPDHGDFRLTANQHLIIGGMREKGRAALEATLKTYPFLDHAQHTGLRLNSMACVALPTCGLALAESERYLPSLVGRIEALIDEAGLRHDAITIRMTGCPNGCARPYVAEIAFVGRAPGIYNMYLGGGHCGERLSKLYKDSVNEEQILTLLAPIVRRYATERTAGEHFGDFVIRVGIVKMTTEGNNFHENLGDI